MPFLSGYAGVAGEGGEDVALLLNVLAYITWFSRMRPVANVVIAEGVETYPCSPDQRNRELRSSAVIPQQPSE